MLFIIKCNIVFQFSVVKMWKLLVLISVSAVIARDIPGKNYVVKLDGPKLQILSNADDKGFQKNLIRAEMFASGFDLEQRPENCDPAPDISCLQWRNTENHTFNMTMKVDAECTTISLYGPPDTTVSEFFYYDDFQWYGGPERWLQEWPVQKMKIENDEPYVTRSANNQGVLEPYWLTSEGTVIYVKPNSLLFFNSNQINGTLGLVAANREPYKPRNSTFLEFDLCSYSDPVTAHRQVIKNYFGKPDIHPGKRMMTYPTYSTWAKYKSDINQEKVMEFTNLILENKYLMGQIEIDDKWETCYGSLIFDKQKFPNITQLTDYIHSKGGRVTVWVTPFINEDCDYYEPALKEGRLILDQNGSAATSWWNGNGGVVDVTNQTTKDWWVQRLRSVMEESGLDGFKFDAGESSWLPQLPEINGDPEFYPESYVRNYVEACAEFGSDLEVRVGRKTQDVPLFIRMLDKDSRWGLDNGLQSVITTALQMSLAGYPFILPDMIGGNAYGEVPSKELFIRWAQANALLPAMQFSLLPWDYDQETIDITRSFLDLHTNYTETFLKISNQTLIDGTPIITPVWWAAPTDPETHPISDQFMLGDSILVAPVVQEGATERNVYLPNGNWTDARGDGFQGPIWLKNYSAPLSYLPIFSKQ